MNEYAIITDSAADLSAELVTQLDLQVVPLSFTIDGKTYLNYPDHREMPLETFYSLMAEGHTAKTSAVNVAQALEAMEENLRIQKDVLVLAFSSGLSSTYQSFCIAATELEERYPERKVYVVDTLCASLGEGMLVYQAANMRKQGKSIDEVHDWAEEYKLHQCHWFTVNDLFHLKRGGRVSSTTAVMGTMLQVKPILNVDNEGHLIPQAKARGRKQSLKALADKAEKSAIDPASQTMFISHASCLDDAQWLADELKRRLRVKEVIISDIGPVIGAHTGIGCVTLFFYGIQR